MLQTLTFTQVRCSVSNFYNFFYWYCWHIIGIGSATVIKFFFFFSPFVLALILWTFIWSHVATSYNLYIFGLLGSFFIGNLGFIGSVTVVSVFECILKRIVDT